jgi:rod shape-determining protein MreC
VKQREAFAARVTVQWRAAAQRLSSVLLVLVALSLIVLGRTDNVLVEGARARIADMAASVLSVVQRPLGTVRDAVGETRSLVDLASENTRLREENGRLKQWEATAYELEAQNQVLRGMVNLKPSAPPILRSEPVIAEPGGIYVRSVLLGGGAHDGLAKGQAAMVGTGLVGRITEIGAWSARVLLITDLNSRIPVVLEGSRTHAIVAGDNTAYPYLMYLPKAALVNVGDRVVTAGHDGMFPTGLAVGRVSSIENGKIRVQPIADLDRLEFVEIVDSAAASALTPEAAPVSQW